MSAPIDPQRLELAREYARARRSDRLAATITDLLSEVLADRDRLSAEVERMSAEPEPGRTDCPELPPGYRVGPCSGGWIAGNADCWFDDGVHGETFTDRAGAVDTAWAHWYKYVADDDWAAFVDGEAGS